MKTIINRSTELIITHSCGEVFAWIPYEDLDKISNKNPVKVKCPNCKKGIVIKKIDSD